MKISDVVESGVKKVSSVKVEMDPKSLECLEESVRDFLKDDIYAFSKVKSYLKTENTLSHSLGDLYSYKQDRNLCLTCGKKLLSCPKKDKKGYQLEPYYVKEDDRVRFQYVPCSLLADMNRVLERISPCDCGTTTLVEDANSLLESLFKGDNIKKQQGLASVFVSVMNDINKKEKLKRGLAFSTVNATEKLSSSLLRLIAYLYARNGFHVSYINTNAYFKQLFSNNPELSYVAQKELTMLKKADVLLFENFDEIPYLDDERTKKYLLPLFEERNKEGKLNFASLLKSKQLSSIVYRNTHLTFTKSELQKEFESLFSFVVIQDLDLR